jgi:cell division protein FtsQ
MTTSRRPRRSSEKQDTEKRKAMKTNTAASSSPSAVETARMRRERRTKQSGFLSGGSSQRQKPARSKPVTHSKSRTRGKTVRTRTIGTPPPVYVRGGMANLPVQPRKLGAPPKRRYNMALSVPGAELHLPAMPVLRFSWRVISGLLAVSLLALAVHLWTSAKYRIDMVEVTGLKRLTANDINTVVGLSGESIFAANPQQVQLDLQQAFPDLKDVSVKVGLPAKVVVKAQERQPIIDWRQDGRDQWVDIEGLGFPPRGEAANLIVVEAKDSPPAIEKTSPMDLRFLSPEMVGVIGRIALKAPKDSTLLYDQEHGLGWTDPFNCPVYFGMDTRDIDEKLLVYQSLAARLQKEGVQPVLISVEYLHAPYYRVER